MVNFEAKMKRSGTTETGQNVVFSGDPSLRPSNDIRVGVAWTWVFHDDPEGTSNPATTKRIGKEVTYVWSKPGVYKVELTYVAQIRTADGYQLLLDTVTTTVTITQGSATPVPSKHGGIADAKKAHKRYTGSLEAWSEFRNRSVTGTQGTSSGDTQIDPDLAYKIRLWNLISNVIQRTKQANSGVEPKKVYDALGIDEDTFTGEYYDDHFDPKGSLSKNLGFGNFAREHIDDRSFAATKDNVTRGANGNEFVLFGRELLSYRTGVENNAKDLAALIKGYGPINPKAWNNEFKLAMNRFLIELRRKPYQDQLTTLATLFEDLSQSEAGKLFLGELFDNRNKESCINPFNVLFPPELPRSERIKQGGPIISVEQGNRSEFFDSGGKLKIRSGTEKVKTVMDAFATLIPELNTGLIYFLQHSDDWRYSTDRSDAEEVVAAFHARIASKYWSAQDLQNKGQSENPNDDDITSTSSQLRAEYADVATKATPVASTSWSLSDSATVTLVVIDHQLKHASVFPTADSKLVPWFDTSSGKGELPTPALPLKFGMIVLSLSMTVYEVGSRGGAAGDDLGWSELTQLSVMTTKYVGDIAGIGEAAGLTLSKNASRAKVLGTLAKLGPYLDIVLLAWEVPAAADQWHKHDYDAAYATMLGITGTAMIAGAELLAGGATLLATVGAPVLLIVGTAVTIAAVVWGLNAADPTLTLIIQVTRFGKHWKGENFSPTDPRRLEFQFTRDGTTHSPRQVTRITTQARPINVTSATMGTDGDDFTLTIEMDPPESKDGVDHIRSDGVIYVRPYYEDGFGRILHRITLSDVASNRNTDSWSSAFPTMPEEATQTWNKSKQWFGSFASHLSAKHRLTEQLLEQHRSVVEQEVATGLSSVDLRPTGVGRVDGPKLKQLTVELKTPFAPLLLGAVPHWDQGGPPHGPTFTYLRWPTDTSLELIYVPPEMDEQFREANLGWEKGGIEDYSVLSREVVSVSGIQTGVEVDSPPAWASDPDWAN